MQVVHFLPSVQEGGERQGMELICYGKRYVEHKIQNRWEFALACALTCFNQFQASFLGKSKIVKIMKWSGFMFKGVSSYSSLE